MTIFTTLYKGQFFSGVVMVCVKIVNAVFCMLMIYTSAFILNEFLVFIKCVIVYTTYKWY